MEIQKFFEQILISLATGVAVLVIAVPLFLLWQRRYEIEIWVGDRIDHAARWREQVRTWLPQHPRVVCLLGVIWLLYALFVMGMLAGAILLHHWFQIVLWSFLTLNIVTPLGRLFPPARAHQRQSEPSELRLPLTAADQEAVKEIYQQARRKREEQ